METDSYEPISERSRIIWKEIVPSKDENAKAFLDRIFENLKESSKSYTNSYYMIIILSAIYWILALGKVTEFTFFSLKVNDINIIMWVIPLLTGYLFYQGVCAFFYELALLNVIKEYIRIYAPKILEKNLEFFIFPPSFFNFERFLISEKNGKPFAFASLAIIGLSILILPILITSFFIYKNLNSLKKIADVTTIQLLLTLVSIGCLVRACALIIFRLRESN